MEETNYQQPTINSQQHVKKSNNWIKIFIIVIIILVVGILGIYLLFFNLTDSKAKKIIREDFYKNPSLICDKFPVADRCNEFYPCYASNAIYAIPNDLLVPIARDIKKGKSTSFDTYSLINGKEIGEACISKMLNIPENVNIDIKTIDSGTGGQLNADESQYLILEDIGELIYDKPGKIDTVGRDSITYISFYKLNGNSDIENSATAFVEVFDTEQSLTTYFDNWIASQEINSEEITKGITVYDTTSSDDIRYKRKKFVWVKDNYIIRIYEPNTSTALYDAYLDKYS